MKLIHMADLHLDSKLDANLPKDKVGIRKNELLHNFERVFEYAVEEKVNVVLIAGDLFDTGRITRTTRDVVYETVRKHPEIQVYYLRGNHDSYQAAVEDLPENMHLFAETWASYELGDNGSGKKVMLYGIELDRNNTGVASAALHTQENDINIVMLHGQQTEYSAGDQAETIHVKKFASKNIDYMALGHVHKYQRDEIDSRGTWCYPGCLEGRGFDEPGEHGFVVLETEGNKIKDTFVPFAKRKIFDCKIDISGLKDAIEISDKISKALKGEGCNGDDILKVTLTGEVDPESDINTSYLNERFKNEYFFIKIKDDTRSRIDFSGYDGDLSLKGEAVRGIADLDMSDERKSDILRIITRALNGEKLER